MDSKRPKRARNAATLVYGASPVRTTLVAAVPPVPPAPRSEAASISSLPAQRFEPPPERALPAAVLPVIVLKHGTMAVPVRRRSGGAFYALVMMGLVAIAIVSNLERLSNVMHKLVPPADVVDVEGAIPLMLFVRSDPPAARVLINGHHVGRTPFAQGYASAGGTVHVRVEARGYEAWESDVTCTAAGMVVNAKLQRLVKAKPLLIVAMH